MLVGPVHVWVTDLGACACRPKHCRRRFEQESGSNDDNGPMYAWAAIAFLGQLSKRIVRRKVSYRWQASSGVPSAGPCCCKYDDMRALVFLRQVDAADVNHVRRTYLCTFVASAHVALIQIYLPTHRQ